MKPAYRLELRLRHWLARLRGEWVRFRIIFAGGRCGRGTWVGRGVVFKYPPHPGLQFGDSVRLGEYAVIDVPCGGSLTLGSQVTCTMGVVLAAIQQIHIGDSVLIGEYASIRDADHGTGAGVAMRTQPMVSSPVMIGNDVWIGRGACILKGVQVNNGAVVGANSVVTQSVAVSAIVAGTPARVLRVRG